MLSFCKQGPLCGPGMCSAITPIACVARVSTYSPTLQLCVIASMQVCLGTHAGMQLMRPMQPRTAGVFKSYISNGKALVTEFAAATKQYSCWH